MSEIRIRDVQADGSTLRATISVSGEVRRFFSGDEHVVEYPVPVEDVPESILSIPVLAQVCPVAWTQDGTVRVSTVDATFRDTLERAEQTFASMYPEFMRGGRLVADEVVDTDPPAVESTGSAQLFTGGVDSLATYVRHREESPTFVTVNGWTEPVEDDQWSRRRRLLEGYSDQFGVEHHFLRSNMLSILDHTMLIAAFKRYLLGSWYSAVGHGVGLLGICAPLSYATGLDRVYVAATYCDRYDHRWGSSPEIVNDVRWTGGEAVHDGFELTRQEKIDEIADFAASEWPDMPIHTCNDHVDGNCGNCEKCYRTAMGLLLAGRDPSMHGHGIDAEGFAHVRRQIETDSWRMDETGCMWQDLQEHAGTDGEYPVEGAEDFFAWLQTVDFAALEAESGAPRRDRVARFAARNVPYSVYETLYPRYATVSSLLDSEDGLLP